MSQSDPTQSTSGDSIFTARHDSGMECPNCGVASESSASSLRSLSRTHDTSLSPYHISLPDWLQQLDEAINSAWCERFVGYSNVAVLMICWEETYQGAQKTEFCRLESVFRDVYNYSVQSFQIPSVDPDLAIFDRIRTLLQQEGRSGNLLIVYYAGHARRNPSGGYFPIWQPRSEPQRGKQIDTASVHSLLVRAQDNSPDVLLSYDCCFPLSSHQSDSNNSRAEVEGLFAGGFESHVPIPGQDSFTKHLTDALATAPDSGRVLTIPELHRSIIVRLQSFHSQPIFDMNNEIRRCSTTNEVLYTKPVRVTPSHLFLAGNEKPRLIALRPLGGNDKGPTTNTITGLESETWPKVLLAVRLVNDENIKDELEEWILNAPPGVIQFQGVLPSYSSLLLVEVPVVVWDLLRPCPAVSFISFVTAKPQDQSTPPASKMNRSTIAVDTVKSIEMLERERTGLINELIKVSDQVLDALSADHPKRAAWLNVLGNSLVIRFECTGSIRNLNRAIEFADQAVNITPTENPDQAMYLINFGNWLVRRFEQTRSKDDFNRGLSLCEEGWRYRGVTLTKPPDHSFDPSIIDPSIIDKFRSIGDTSQCDDSQSIFSRAINTDTSITEPSVYQPDQPGMAAASVTRSPNKRRRSSPDVKPQLRQDKPLDISNVIDMSLACPFFLESKESHQYCAAYKLLRIVDVRCHIQRCHAPRYICHRCWLAFSDLSERDSHMQEITCVAQKDPRGRSFATQDQWEEIAKLAILTRRPGYTVEQCWYLIWDILFPDIARPLSPYIDVRKERRDRDVTASIAQYQQDTDGLLGFGRTYYGDDIKTLAVFEQFLAHFSNYVVSHPVPVKD